MLRFCLPLLFLFLILSGCHSARENGFIEKKSSRTAESNDPYIKDFGFIKSGEVVVHSFLIKNDSQKVLNIKDVTTSCGCAVSEVKKRVLNPGESTSLDVKFDSKGYSGVVQQFVYVNTDRLDDSLIRFIIKANVTQ